MAAARQCQWGLRLPGHARSTREPRFLPCLAQLTAARPSCSPRAAPPQGGPTGLGACRKSCGECAVCAEGDAACARENRVRAGYLPFGYDPDLF